jgi:hypothetical protein
MDDLHHRDFSNVPDEELSAEERREIRRRLDTFVGRMQMQRTGKPKAAPKPKAKRLAAWKPKIVSRRSKRA